MNLGELQTDFQQKLLDVECVGADWVNDSAHDLTSRDRLNIYHNAYRVRLIDVLLDTFEHTAIYLGNEWFHQLAANYVQTHNSTHTNIGLYGKQFPEYLAEQLNDDMDVAELALMDWKLRRAFDGADSTVMTQEDLQQLASGENPDIRLQAVPTLTITPQYFNTLDIWHAINLEEHPPETEKLPEPVDILIWRKGHSPHFRSLSTIESVAITYINMPSTLDEIGETLANRFPETDIVTEFGVMLNRWIDDEIICISA